MAQNDETTTRAALLAERAQLQREIAEYTHGEDSAFPDTPHDTTDLPVGDEADAAENLEDDERNQQILAILRDRLAEIDATLARMDAGGDH